MKKIILLIGLVAMFVFLMGCTENVEDNLTDNDSDEQMFCAEYYEPVCGVNGKTYSNDCFANIEKISIAYEGECGSENAFTENRICTKEYMPVCGADGATYGNKCMAGNMNIAYEGECGSENAFTEPRACTKEYMPVCGADGVTYGNKCMAGNMNIAYQGECVNECDSCPMYAPPGPGFCVDGIIMPGFVNDCGCQGPPVCEPALSTEKVYCTPEQKAAQICTMEYMPVCGADGVTYGNKCGACGSGVDYYVAGECS